MRIFHIATAADWAGAQQTGRYTTSTRGVTLAEEGFIHASRADQWQGVRDRFYADVTEPLVLLVIDTERLTAPVVEEPVADSAETFPHVYGVIEPAAVVQVIPLEEAAPGRPAPSAAPAVEAPISAPPARPFFSLFLEEMAWRAGLGVLVMAVAVLVGLGVGAVLGDVAALVTILVLIVVGIVATAVVLRRRERRLAPGADSTQ